MARNQTGQAVSRSEVIPFAGIPSPAALSTGTSGRQNVPIRLLSPPEQAPGGAIDTATLELLAAWKAQDATTNPEGVSKRCR
jgi:hypothetical protein